MKSTLILLAFSRLLLSIVSVHVHQHKQTTDSPLLPRIADKVQQQIDSQRKMTTRQLTLNFSGISFPAPARQGDNLNLSAIKIPGAGRCGNGYILKENSCLLGDLLMMQNLEARNLIVGSLNLEELKAKQQEYIQNNPNFTPLKCEGQKPFLSKQGCISCSDPHPYFNLEAFKCSKCPEGSSYNPEVRNCQKAGSNFLSNLENKNYLVLPNKPLSQYREEYIKLKQKNPDVQTCPADKPFSTGGQCTSCPQGKPLFFLPARACTRCRQGSTFNEQSNSCIAAAGEGRSQKSEPQEDNSYQKFGRQKWTVEKGLANIFGWSRDSTSDMIDRAEDTQGSKEDSSEGENTSGKESAAAVSTTTQTTNRLVRKATDSQDEPGRSGSNKGASGVSNENAGAVAEDFRNVTRPEVRNVVVGPKQQKSSNG